MRIGTCSTPIGITGTRTVPSCARTGLSASAQRRLASRGRELSRFSANFLQSDVLNADWHHGDENTTRAARQVNVIACAQRRLASRGREPRSYRCVRVVRAKQCSTPIGITGTRTSACASRWPTSWCAQRRLASRGRERDQGRKQFRKSRVLNADWHHGDENYGATERLQAARAVLNADWHHGDENTIGHREKRPDQVGAQRRLASRGREREGGAFGRGVRGIVLNADWHHGDENEGSLRPRNGATKVLNADWHHGDENLTGEGWFRRTSRVLNADWHHGDENAATMAARATLAGAQRRLASRGREPQVLRHADRVQWIVLNADWHHGDENRKYSTLGVGGTYSAQRRLASRGREPDTKTKLANSGLCSTPIGITGTRTPERPRRGGRQNHVLNADWHHGDENRPPVSIENPAANQRENHVPKHLSHAGRVDRRTPTTDPLPARAFSIIHGLFCCQRTTLSRCFRELPNFSNARPSTTAHP